MCYNITRGDFMSSKRVIKFSTFLFAFAALNVSLMINCILIYFIFSNYYELKKEVVTKNVVPENIVFLGDSITNRYDIEKYFPEYNTVKSGIEGNRTLDIIDDLDDRVYKYNPSKIILLVGVNDLLHDDAQSDDVYKNIVKIVNEIKKNRPNAKIYIETVLPINEELGDFHGITPRIIKLNEKLKKYGKENNITIINLYDKFVDKNNYIKKKYTTDGVHVTDEGYEIITNEIKKAIKK